MVVLTPENRILGSGENHEFFLKAGLKMLK